MEQYASDAAMKEQDAVESEPLKIANIAIHRDREWTWILRRADFHRPIDAEGFASGALPRLLGRMPGIQSYRRHAAAHRFAVAGRAAPFDLAISQGPHATVWTAAQFSSPSKSALQPASFHLAYAFNFTDLPKGPRRALYQRMFRRVDCFVVFTKTEKALYARYFQIPEEKFLIAPWGVAAPVTRQDAAPLHQPYFAALGGEARDYETLCKAAALCPDTLFICIARPWNFKKLVPPPNMRVLFNLPADEAWGIVEGAVASIIPLKNQETPCGLVTLIGGMHLGKAQIVTGAAGVSDYVEHENTGILVPPQSPWAIANGVNRLLGDPALAARIGANARAFAATACSEQATFSFLQEFIRKKFP